MSRNRKRRLWEKVRTGFWFVPSLMLVAAAVLAWLTLRVDSHMDPGMEATLRWAYSGGPEGARSLLSTVAGSMITAASVTFSLASVALSLASQQYGSRVLRNFMRDTVTQVMLGVFVATFFYCVLVVRAIRGSEYGGGFVPAISVTCGIVLTLVSLLSLVYFIHHVSASIQASRIIDVIGVGLKSDLHTLFPEGTGTPAKSQAVPDFDGGRVATLAVTTSGYIESIDVDRLLSIASKLGAVIVVEACTGDHVLSGQSVARLHGAASLDEPTLRSLIECFLVEGERSPVQDIRFRFQQLTDVIVRAMSPGINDPFTAINGIDQLTVGLVQMARAGVRERVRLDEGGQVRLVLSLPSIGEVLDQTIGHISIYSAGDRFVMQRLRRALDATEREAAPGSVGDRIRDLRRDLDLREAAKAVDKP